MDQREANDQRLIASEIVRQLYDAKAVSQLELIQITVNRALELLAAPKPKEVQP